MEKKNLSIMVLRDTDTTIHLKPEKAFVLDTTVMIKKINLLLLIGPVETYGEVVVKNDNLKRVNQENKYGEKTNG
jgi:hypothetical protein